MNIRQMIHDPKRHVYTSGYRESNGKYVFESKDDQQQYRRFVFLPGRIIPQRSAS